MNLDDNKLTIFINGVPQSPVFELSRKDNEMMYLTAMISAGDVLSIKYFGSNPPDTAGAQ